MGECKSQSRRTVLKTMVASGVGLASTGVASAKTSREQFRGYAYNPKTHQLRGEASATVVSNENKLNGVLRLPSKTIPIKSDTKLGVRGKNNEVHRFKSRTNKKSASNEKKGHEKRFDVNLDYTSGGLSGLLVDLEEGERIAFSLVSKTGNMSAVKNELNPSSKKDSNSQTVETFGSKEKRIVDADTTSKNSTTVEYKYAFGLINKMEDSGLTPSQIIQGGDIRLQLNGWFPTELSHAGEPAYVTDMEFHLDPVQSGTVQTTDLNPASAQSAPFESGKISLSYGVGPYSATFAEWQLNTDPPTVKENYQGETDYAFWRETPDGAPTKQESATGASVDLQVDESVSVGETIEAKAKSNFTWAYTPTLTGSTIYTTSSDINLSKKFDVVY